MRRLDRQKNDRSPIISSIRLVVQGMTTKEVSDQLKIPGDAGKTLPRAILDLTLEPVSGSVSTWILYSKVDCNADLDTHVRNLLGRVSAAHDSIAAMIRNGAIAELNVAQFVTGKQWSLSLSSELSRRIGELGLKLSIRCYDKSQFQRIVDSSDH